MKDMGWQDDTTLMRAKQQGIERSLSPEEPFAYLQRLKDAYLAEKDGQIGAQWEESR